MSRARARRCAVEVLGLERLGAEQNHSNMWADCPGMTRLPSSRGLGHTCGVGVECLTDTAARSQTQEDQCSPGKRSAVQSRYDDSRLRGFDDFAYTDGYSLWHAKDGLSSMKLVRLSKFLCSRMLDNLRIDAAWLASPLPDISLSGRVVYLMRKYFAIFLNRRSIAFLSGNFSYDNRLTPALLQTYPSEIRVLSRLIDFSRLKTVFDVGANVGQFAWTLKHFHRHLEVFSFEPNPNVFPLLQANSRGRTGWRVLNFGIGPIRSATSLYVVPGKSSQGSVFRENSVMNLLATEADSLTVELHALDAQSLATRESTFCSRPSESGRRGF